MVIYDIESKFIKRDASSQNGMLGSQNGTILSNKSLTLFRIYYVVNMKFFLQFLKPTGSKSGSFDISSKKRALMSLHITPNCILSIVDTTFC